MKTVHVLRLAILLTFFLGGCATNQLTDEQIASADYGPYPENYREIVKAYFSAALKDPYSANYNFERPYKGYSTKSILAGGGPDKFGYLVKVYVNAKNSFGAYTGWEPYLFLIRNGRIIQRITVFQ